jgi:hypothetical protein
VFLSTLDGFLKQALCKCRFLDPSAELPVFESRDLGG